MPEPKTISIVEGGQRWSAAYETSGKSVRVMSAYGGQSAQIGRKPVQQVAEDVFRAIVRQRLGAAR